MLKRLILLFLLFSLFVSPLYAETYWIDDTVGGKSSLDDCKGETPLSGTDACLYTSVDYDGSSIVAGDTVYFREGDYSFADVAAIDPTNSGTSASNLITYSSYNGETVNLNSTNGAFSTFDLDSGQSWIKINDFRVVFNAADDWWDIIWAVNDPATHIELSNNTFIGLITSYANRSYHLIRIQLDGQFWWIHDNTIGQNSKPYTGSGDQFGGIMDIGWASGSDDTSYNLIEDNEFYKGGHDTVGIHGRYNMVRGNYFHNEPHLLYEAKLYGHRVMFTISGWSANYNLIEGNRIAYGSATGAANDGNCTDEGFTNQGNYQIFRYNMFYQNEGSGLSTAIKPISDNSSGSVTYNNTFWYNGYNAWMEANCSSYFDSYSHAAIVQDDATYSKDNEYINNIFYNNRNLVSEDRQVAIYTNGGVPQYQVIRDNWVDNDADPKFTDISGTPDPDQEDQFDFSLQSDSGAIDAGGRLTDVATADDCNGGVGCDTTIQVDNATFFQDGFGIQDVWTTANVNEDWICVGTVSNCAQIDSINYSTNILTMKNALDRDDGDDVWLYKDSSGEVVLLGTAPDYGAHEYGALGSQSVAIGSGSQTITTGGSQTLTW